MIAYSYKAKVYIDTSGVTDIESELSRISEGEVVVNQTGMESYQEFFEKLKIYEDANGQKCKKYKKWYAYRIEVLLPNSIEYSDLIFFCKAYMREVTGKERLPYVAVYYKKGKGRYITFLISERKYFSEEKKRTTYHSSDVYRNKKGRICSAEDDGAVKSFSKGDIKKVEYVNFGYKSRIFTVDIYAKKNKRSVSKWFEKLRNKLVQLLIYCFTKFRVNFNYQVFLAKKKHKSSMNKYQIMNVTRLNALIHEIQISLEKIYQVMISPAKYSQEQKNVDRFRSLFFKYKYILNAGEFSLSMSNGRKKKALFSIYQRVDVFQERIHDLKCKFEEDWMQCYINMVGAVKFAELGVPLYERSDSYE